MLPRPAGDALWGVLIQLEIAEKKYHKTQQSKQLFGLLSID